MPFFLGSSFLFPLLFTFMPPYARHSVLIRRNSLEHDCSARALAVFVEIERLRAARLPPLARFPPCIIPTKESFCSTLHGFSHNTSLFATIPWPSFEFIGSRGIRGLISTPCSFRTARPAHSSSASPKMKKFDSVGRCLLPALPSRGVPLAPIGARPLFPSPAAGYSSSIPTRIGRSCSVRYDFLATLKFLSSVPRCRQDGSPFITTFREAFAVRSFFFPGPSFVCTANVPGFTLCF